ncbi:MAG: nicotinamide mononucleotide transporter [Clostridia bacterium]|nr:nicotinamide mononucleotide transporter [Clostridia bacterium]
MNFLKTIKSLTVFEWCLWAVSSLIVLCSFLLSDAVGPLQFIGSLIGVSALIFVSKGNVFGQILMIAFCIIYGYISFTEQLYGEMITYVGMSCPMAIFSLISWIKNPSNEDASVVKVNKIRRNEVIIMFVAGIAVTVIFYFILSALGTANIYLSTASVLTSFIPAYLTLRRSPYYALGYVFNDLVVITIWIIASLSAPSNWALVACFVAFLLNDIYGFINWKKMEKTQR